MTVVMGERKATKNTEVIASRLNFLEKTRNGSFSPDVEVLVIRRLVFVSTQVAIGEFLRTVHTLDNLKPSDPSNALMAMVNKRWGTFLYEDSSCNEPRAGLKKFLEGMIHCPVLSSPEMLCKLPEVTLLAYKELAKTLDENFNLL